MTAIYLGCEKLKSNKKIKIISGQSERAFMTGVLLLSASTVIVKIIGLAYKIPLLSILGAEGMGYFNSAYEIYAMLCVISTAGIPVALSILISGALERGDMLAADRIYKTALRVLCILGFAGSSALCAFAKPISSFVGNPSAYYCILAVSPALLFSCVSGAARGYFQGRRNMFPTALSQLTEALGKLILGVALALRARERGMPVPIASAFAVLGLVIGGAVSASYLVAAVVSDKRKNKNVLICAASDGYGKGALASILHIAFPITLGAALLGVTRVIDMTLIMRRLQYIGISTLAANEIYGSYTTLALPVFSLIPALVTPISESLIPRLSAAVETGETSEQRAAVEKSIRLTALLGMPSSMGILLYSRQILGLIFRGQPQAIAIASPLLATLGASVLFSCLITTTNAILQSYRKVILPIASMAVGAIVKSVSAYLLIGSVGIGELGAPISTLLCDVTVVGLNIFFVDRAVPQKTSTSKLLVKPFFASLAAIALSASAYLPVYSVTDSESLAFLVALVCAAASYFGFAVLFGALKSEDLASLPIIDKFYERKIKKVKNKVKNKE